MRRSRNSDYCFRIEQKFDLLRMPRQGTEFVQALPQLFRCASSTGVCDEHHSTERTRMSKEEENKAVVGRWFTHFWGEICDLGIVDELAAPDMLLHYSLHASTVPQKLRSGNALRKSVMNALMSSRPRRGASCPASPPGMVRMAARRRLSSSVEAHSEGACWRVGESWRTSSPSSSSMSKLTSCTSGLEESGSYGCSEAARRLFNSCSSL